MAGHLSPLGSKPLSVLVTGSSGFIGSQRRDLTHVSDVVRAVDLALRWRGAGVGRPGRGHRPKPLGSGHPRRR